MTSNKKENMNTVALIAVALSFIAIAATLTLGGMKAAFWSGEITNSVNSMSDSMELFNNTVDKRLDVIENRLSTAEAAITNNTMGVAENRVRGESDN